MRIPRYALELADQLTGMVEKTPDVVPVVALTRPDLEAARRRLDTVMRSVAQFAGLKRTEMRTEIGRSRTVLRGHGSTRAVMHHASGAMVVKLGLDPFDKLFEADPGDEKLTEMVKRTTVGLGLPDLVEKEDRLDFEKLWRVKAAGADPNGKVAEPVLCRAVGAYRHYVQGLPVYGRASVSVELAGSGEPASLSVSLRRFADDGGGQVVAEAKVARPEAAAESVAYRIAKSFGGQETLRDTRLVAEWFRFGYLSLGRRREQAALAPFYIASVTAEGVDSSAHLIAVPGSTEQFLRVSDGQRAASGRRTA